MELPKTDDEIQDASRHRTAAVRQQNEYVHQRMWMFVDPTEVILQPVDAVDGIPTGQPNLIISRLPGPADVSERIDPPRERNGAQELWGVLGVVGLAHGLVLLGIVQRQRVGVVGSAEIFRITDVTSLWITVLEGPIPSQDREYREMVETVAGGGSLYFSPGVDLSRPAARSLTPASEGIAANAPSVASLGGVRGATDSRFWWNKPLLSPLLRQGLTQWVVPVIEGFVRVVVDTLHDQPFDYVILSRRSCNRAGARYHARGADPEGHVANFVETEQLVRSRSLVSSFVQIRGSILLIWHQKGKGLKPKPIVDHTIYSLTKNYKKQVVVNLIDQTGTEADLRAEFSTNMKLLNSPNIRYVAFDFHERCKNNKYENLQELLEIVKDDLDQFGYFLQDSSGSIVLEQKGAFRTNCVDCLDRTNVVQAVFAHYMLKKQLQHLGLISSDQNLEEFSDLQGWFKNGTFEFVTEAVWADNADAMSSQYTGTGALKAPSLSFSLDRRILLARDEEV